MTPLILIETLVKNLQEVLKNQVLAAEYQPDRQVQVFAHDLPRGDFENNTFYPCVIVTLKSVEDEGDNSIATVTLTVGAYSDDIGNDWRDMFNIAEKIRQFILTHPIIGNFFPLVEPVAFEPITAEVKDSDPFVFGIIAVRYKVASPKYNFEDFFDKKRFFL